MGALRPTGEALADFAEHGRADVFILALNGVLVIVQQQQGQHRPGGLKDVPGVGKLGDVQPVGGGQQALLLSGRGARHVAEHLVAPVPQLHLPRALALPLQQPAGVKVGGQVGHLGIKHPLLVFREAQKAVVGPHHLVGVRAEHHQGQGAVKGAIPGGLVHTVHQFLQVLVRLPLAPQGGCPAGDQQHAHHNELRHRRLSLPQQGGDPRESQHHPKVQPDARGQQPRQLMIHHLHLFPTLSGAGAAFHR